MDSLHPKDLMVTGSSESGTRLVAQSAAQTALVVVRDERVYDILNRNLFLRPIIVDGIRVARDIFGGSCAVALEVYEDPSGADDLQIFVMLRAPAAYETARELIEQFDTSWWVDHVAATRGLLAFALEHE
jgi:hypothetical protein